MKVFIVKRGSLIQEPRGKTMHVGDDCIKVVSKEAADKLAYALELTINAFTKNHAIDWGECENILSEYRGILTGDTMGKMKLKELFIDIKTMLERWDGIPGLLGRKRMISRLEEAILEL